MRSLICGSASPFFIGISATTNPALLKLQKIIVADLQKADDG
jgi:hypothetical protein